MKSASAPTTPLRASRHKQVEMPRSCLRQGNRDRLRNRRQEAEARARLTFLRSPVVVPITPREEHVPGTRRLPADRFRGDTPSPAEVARRQCKWRSPSPSSSGDESTVTESTDMEVDELVLYGGGNVDDVDGVGQLQVGQLLLDEAVHVEVNAGQVESDEESSADSEDSVADDPFELENRRYAIGERKLLRGIVAFYARIATDVFVDENAPEGPFYRTRAANRRVSYRRFFR